MWYRILGNKLGKIWGMRTFAKFWFYKKWVQTPKNDKLLKFSLLTVTTPENLDVWQEFFTRIEKSLTSSDIWVCKNGTFSPFFCHISAKKGSHGLMKTFFSKKWTKWANFWPVSRYGLNREKYRGDFRIYSHFTGLLDAKIFLFFLLFQ